MTSPVRASVAAGESSSAEMSPDTTVTLRDHFAFPAVAVSVALPGRTPVTTPAFDTLTTPGAELVHVGESFRRSSSAVYTLGTSRSCWPATSFVTAGATSMRAAAPGTIRTLTFSMNGLAPGTSAITDTCSAPVEPDVTRPVESTLPSNQPPAFWKRTVASGTALPCASSARAVSRSVSPAATTGAAGLSAIFVTGEAGAAGTSWAASTAGASASRSSGRTRAVTGTPGDGRWTGSIREICVRVAPPRKAA